MFKKPVFIAAVISLLACIPLYFLSTQEFQLNTGNLPLIALSLFVIILIATYWSNATAHYHEPDSDENRSHAPRESGNVKWFNANKGFGFITRDSGEDVFVHFRSIRGNGHRVLHDGERVEFAVSEGDKGPQAEDVAVAR
ncbi:MAG: cold-shock protein [Proteobacteria bacterium]|nr:cold-shock protein [Pseudomonadota bacterium]